MSRSRTGNSSSYLSIGRKGSSRGTYSRQALGNTAEVGPHGGTVRVGHNGMFELIRTIDSLMSEFVETIELLI